MHRISRSRWHSNAVATAGALVLCGVTVEGVIRGTAVPENHADRNACIDKADRGGTGEDESVCKNVFVLKNCVCTCVQRGMRGMDT